jgi:hypothetical protein
MKKALVSLVAAAALTAPASWASVAAAQPGNGQGQENDANGDLHSNCHTGSKLRGAGGNDKGDLGECFGAPVTPPGPGAPPAAPGAPRAGAAAPVSAAGPAVPVVAAPRTTG